MTQKDDEILKLARKRFGDSSDVWSNNRMAYADDLRFVSGEQWPDTIMNERNIEGRACLTINRMPQFIRQVTNDQRQNRPSIKIRPVDDNADVETAEMMQGLIRHIEANSNADLAYDNGCYCSVAGGFGFWRIVTDYVPKSFEQDIYIKAIENPLTVFPDANSKALDGSDWRYCFIVDDVPRDDFEAEYGENMPTGWDAGDGLDNGLSLTTRDSVRIAEYFCIESVADRLLLIDGYKTVYKSEWDGVGVVTDERECDRKKVMWYKLGGNTVIDRREVAGEYIPVIVCYGDMINIAGERKLVSLIRYGKDSQRMLNYYRSTETELMALQPRAPFVAAEGQLEGYEEIWATANNVNHSYLPYKPTTIAGVAVAPPQRMNPASLPAGLQAMSEIAERDLMNTVGIHEAGLGMKSNETSGVAIQARQREGDVATYHFIDNVTRAIRQTGKVLVSMIPVVYDTQRVARIMGEDGEPDSAKIDPNQAEPVKKIIDQNGLEIDRIYNPGVGTYDVMVTTGPSYMTKRQEALESMGQLLQGNPQLWAVAGDLFIKNMDWPGAQEMAKRFAKTIDPKLMDDGDKDPALQAAEQQMQAMAQEMEQMHTMLQNVSKSMEAQDIERKNYEAQIKAFDAETKRISAVQAGMTFEQIQDIVMGTVAAALDTGDLISGAPQREPFEMPMEQPPMDQMQPPMDQGMMPPEQMQPPPMMEQPQ